MPKIIQVNIGDKFGSWEVKEVIRGKFRETVCLVQCKCGKQKHKGLADLRGGRSEGCGCERHAKSTKHGHNRVGKRSKLYNVWCGMRQRCYDESQMQGAKYYQANDINVCTEWDSDFVNFMGWALSSGYQDGLSIERKDVNGNYEPDNCTWIPRNKQSRNRRDTKMLTAFGETKGLAEWIDDPRCIVKGGTFKSRVYREGWDAEKAMTTPSKHTVA